jgi:hypothetical protein
VASSLVSKLASLRRYGDALQAAESIPSITARAQALLNASRYSPGDSSSAALLAAVGLALQDSSQQGIYLRQNLAQQLAERGNWAGVLKLERTISEPRVHLQFLVAIAQHLRTRGDASADSLYRVAWSRMDSLGKGDPARVALLNTYINGYRAGPADSNYMVMAASITEANTRNTYLQKVSEMFATQGDTAKPLHIAGVLLAGGDTAAALRVLTSAGGLLGQRPNARPAARAAAVSMLERAIELAGPSGKQHLAAYAHNARAQLVSLAFERTRSAVLDSGLAVLPDWAQDSYVRSLMSRDIREALLLAKTIADTERSSQLLSNIAQRQASAGYVDDAIATIAMITSTRAKAQARLQLANHRLQYGDTTDVRAIVQEVLSQEHAQTSQFNHWALSSVVVQSGLLDEFLVLVKPLSDLTKAQLLLSLADQLRR